MLRAADALAPAMENRRAEGPSIRRSLTGLRQYRHLLRNLVLKDLKLKYRGSVIGFVWSLANPLVMVVVYTIAFTTIIRSGSGQFVFYLMLGLLAWTFFAGSAAMSTGAITDNGGLLKSVWFPRTILPTATVLFNLVQYLLTVMVFLPLMLAYYQVPLGKPMLLFPVFVALQALMTIGLALILATATTFFRDVRHLVDVALAVLFWTTPIVYDMSQISSGRLRQIFRFSPMTPYVTAYHDIFYSGQWPDGQVWMTTVGYAVAAVALGLWLIVRYEDGFAERV
jgi:ABC-type polysaccharide/polyol phosphate export permease